MSGFQDVVADPEPALGVVAQLRMLGWIDKTALVVLFAFFVMGLFKGLIWQVSRIGILLAAYFASGAYGHRVASWIAGPAPTAATAPGPARAGAQPLASTPSNWPEDTTLYLAYCLLFVAVLIVLSLLSMLIKKLADRAGLGFFDRLGGGVLGVATGSCVVLAMLMGIHMFFPGSQLAQASGSSHSLRFSRRAIELFGTTVDDDLRKVLELAPLRASGDGIGPVDPAEALPPSMAPPSPSPGPPPSPSPDLLDRFEPGAATPPAVVPGEPRPAAERTIRRRSGDRRGMR